MSDELPRTLDQAELLQSAAASWNRQFDRARARAAVVDANPEAQPWELEHARDALATAQRAVDQHAVVLALASC